MCADDLQTSFGISVGNELITVRGRELPAPNVEYARGRRFVPEDGSWNMAKQHVFKAGKPVKSWRYLIIEDRGSKSQRADLEKGVQGFVKFMSDNMGLSIPKASSGGYYCLYDRYDLAGSERNLRSHFQSMASNRPDLVLVVVPRKEALPYNVVKKLGDIDFGLVTVCMRSEKVISQQYGYFANVGIKVNLKLGGINHRVEDPTGGLIQKTMFVGYDVTHPTNLAPGAGTDAPSLVGLVANIDSAFAQWPGVAWANDPRVEQVGKGTKATEFKDHFKGRIHLWQKHNNNVLPDNIVIFRDGVSEGQFQMVLKEELPLIREACRDLYKVLPKISLIVSVKRHQTRFFPTNRDHAPGASKSPKHGTIVDRGVTNVRYWDFFLQAHASIQGKFMFTPAQSPSTRLLQCD
jgi:hypothetical protein